jgi:DNA-binding transcriptional regulator YiaG
MKYLYDRDRDALTVFFSDRKAVDTAEMWPGVIVDLDDRGRPVSIDFLANASKTVDVKGLANLRTVRVSTPAEFFGVEKVTRESLRSRREGLGLTQSELGELLSVTSNSIARWERGEANIEHPKMLARALEALERAIPRKRLASLLIPRSHQNSKSRR